MYDSIPSPSVVIDLDQIDSNIRSIVQANARYGIRVRPHIKTHKSVWLAKRQIELGCRGITCAKLGEAEVMADHGLDDILIAFPLIGFEKMKRLKQLMQRVSVITLVNSLTGAQYLSDVGMELNHPVKVLLDLDGGIRRGGLEPLEPALRFAESTRHLAGIEIIGIMYYAGNIYSERERDGFERMTRREHDNMLGTARLLESAGFRMDILSGGNSFSGKLPHLLKGLTEVRSGNFIFNDCNQLSTGMATVEECALRVVATVVSRMDDRHVIIDAGSKTLTSDLCEHRPGFGFVVEHPDILIEKLNEEHGFLSSHQPINLEIGDRVSIIPNHSCGLPNLTDTMYGMRDGRLERMITVDARGKNQ
ncbi:MAG: alanine racemase [Eubacteriales bacterium]|jgi:D-serine deaminase-like pyridoxal phosphate-dependent protein|nr:alanine racemase [Eubacteriales bacterium]